MNWKEQLKKFENSRDWKSAIELMQRNLDQNPDDVEAYVTIIYLLHNFLVEEDYLESEHDHWAGLLKQYFVESQKNFSDNAEYLFFIGKILYIAEWYFGVDDDFKPVEEKKAFKMQKKAFEKEPKNTLFEWAYRFSLDDKLSGYLAQQILVYDKTKVEWLKLKGFPGEYILESLERSKEKYEESI